MNIYKHELKTHLRSILIWSVSISALILIYMSIYPAFSKDFALLDELMSNFPKELLIAFGMTNMDWSNPLGFFGLVFLFCQICLAIQAANYGFSLVSIEENELTADFLLAKPVGRAKIMTSKFLAALTSLTITNAVVWLSSLIFIPMFTGGKEYPLTNLVMLLLTILVFQLFFLSVGTAISLLLKRVRNVTPFSMGLVFGLYILNAFGGMLGEKSLEVISPFKHFDPNYILKNAAYDPLALISVGTVVVALICSYWLYARRNILSAT
jgi:ABC-2 type transport system permease protein